MSFVTPVLRPCFPRCTNTDSSAAFTKARKQTSHIVSFLCTLLYAELVLMFGVATGLTSGASSSVIYKFWSPSASAAHIPIQEHLPFFEGIMFHRWCKRRFAGKRRMKNVPQIEATSIGPCHRPVRLQQSQILHPQ